MNHDESEKALIAAEAALRDLLAETRLHGMSNRALMQEAELAALVDELAGGRSLPEASPLDQLVELMAVLRSMDSALLPTLAVPDVLRNVVANTLQKRNETPSIVVRLSRRGLSLVKSTLAGMELAPQSAVAVRSAATAPVTPRLDMTQVIGNGLALEYQVMQESDAEMMLVIRFRGRPEGTYRVDLREDDRIVASQMVQGNSDTASFTRIGEGGYQVDIAGPANHSFGLFVSADQ